MDDFIGIPYPVRGIKTEEGWEFGALTFSEIQKLKTPFLTEALRIYSDYKLFGLPHGRGSASERQIILDVIRILEDETNGFDLWEMEQKK